MNREIKFRVRNMKTKELVGYERINEQGHWEQQRIGRKEWLLGVMTDGQVGLEFIREQYTGLKDKNGTEIYEGDVYTDHYGETRKVVYRNGHFAGKAIKSIGQQYLMFGSYARQIKVIGNIYQNPELLKTA